MTGDRSRPAGWAPTGSTRLAAVIGDPVRHSLSPAIHNAAFAALGLDWVYLALPVPAGRGGDAVAAMRTLGIDGLSVTMPHKEAVAAAVDRPSPTVLALGACNCVWRDGDDLVGESTDGDGLVRSLADDHGIPIGGRRVLVVGTGGAARSIIEAVGRHDPAGLVVASRDPSRAATAAALAPGARTGTPDDAADADLIINATPVGMAGGPDPTGLPVPAATLHPGQAVVDIVYQPRRTPLLAAAATAGATPVDGVGMLIHQAAIAFERWTGQPAPVAVMRAAGSGVA
ncbi:MAG: shikimate dehydrogenase [Acidimicrobiales bacterium]